MTSKSSFSSPEVAGFDGIADCRIGGDAGCEATALDVPLECSQCHARIPASVAVGFEGVDYVHHFCGPQCIEAWCRKTHRL